ncbi:MAG: hypothetical protein JSS62_04045 [Verrucomicrobia bacterium]|nr:hypothetical protein [Verrucomicrobiota bacterium]MBS0647215.1 hypothetical protein [Verrucomicrobiota bacterium]
MATATPSPIASSSHLARAQPTNEIGLLGTRTIKPLDKQKCCSSCILIALGIATLVCVGGLGVAGVLQAHGITLLSKTFPFLNSAIGTIGHTPIFWTMAAGGLVAGVALIAWGARRIHLARKECHSTESSSSSPATSISIGPLKPEDFGQRFDEHGISVQQQQQILGKMPATPSYAYQKRGLEYIVFKKTAGASPSSPIFECTGKLLQQLFLTTTYGLLSSSFKCYGDVTGEMHG